MGRRTARPDIELRDTGKSAPGRLTADSDSPSFAVSPAVGIAAIVVVAAALRFYRLDARSLWLDEILTSWPAHLRTPVDVWNWSASYIDQMPLFYLFTWALGAWGDTPFLLRLPAAVFGTLMVPAIFLLGRSLFNARVGLIAALVTTLIPFAVWYSQEARNYTLFMLLTTLQMYAAWTVVKRGRAVDWLALAAVTILNLYTHYLALVATAAVAAYLALVWLTAVLRRASTQVRAAVAAMLVIGLAAAVLIRWRPILKSLYVQASGIAARHTKVSAAAAAGAIAMAVAAAVVIDRRWQLDEPARRLLRQGELGLGIGLLVVIAYLPWLPALRTFIGAPNVGVGRLNTGQTAHLNQLLGIPPQLGLSGVVLALLIVGLIGVLFAIRRGQALQSTLLLCWLLVPLLLFAAVLRGAIVTIDVRYFSFMFPAAMLLVALGIESGIVLTQNMVHRAHRDSTSVARIAPPAVALALLGLLLVQLVPALAASYNTPKDEWRATAAHIAANSPPGSVVISAGNYSDWAIDSLDYYFRQQHKTIRLINAVQMTSEDVAALSESSGTTWGVVNHPSAAQRQLLSASSLEKVDFVDVTHLIYVVRPATDGLAKLEQARQLLRWESPIAPELNAPLKMLDLAAGQAQPGPNLVAVPQPKPRYGWVYGPGVSTSDTALVMTPNGKESDASFNVDGLTSGDDVFVAFDHQTNNFHGAQTVYALALNGSGQEITEFPVGGYTCAPSSDWSRSYFAFRLPPGTASVVVWFRASGTGTAAFQAIWLSKVT